MVRAWLMDDNTEVDQRQPHQCDPPVPIDLDEIKKLGVLYFKIEGDDFDNNELLQTIRKDRGYNYEDSITCSKEKLPNYEEKIKMFFEEHLHEDEEIRLCTEGSGYFDVRDKQERWIRIQLFKGDLIILPAGIFHRFTMDDKNFIQARRYFIGEPVWTPHNRSLENIDENPVRKQYVSTLESA